MSSWNSSVVLDGQLHTNGRSCWSSTSAVCQSAEVDRSALSSEHFSLSVFCCCGSVDLEFAARQSSRTSTESQHFRRQLKTHFFAKYLRDVLSALEISLRMRYINLHFTYLHTVEDNFTFGLLTTLLFSVFLQRRIYLWTLSLAWWKTCFFFLLELH